MTLAVLGHHLEVFGFLACGNDHFPCFASEFIYHITVLQTLVLFHLTLLVGFFLVLEKSVIVLVSGRGSWKARWFGVIFKAWLYQCLISGGYREACQKRTFHYSQHLIFNFYRYTMQDLIIFVRRLQFTF